MSNANIVSLHRKIAGYKRRIFWANKRIEKQQARIQEAQTGIETLSAQLAAEESVSTPVSQPQ